MNRTLVLQGLIEIRSAKRRRRRKDEPKSRESSVSYFVETTSVSEKAFIALHSVIEMRGRRLCTLIVNGESIWITGWTLSIVQC
jgi:hypothetical protein